MQEGFEYVSSCRYYQQLLYKWIGESLWDDCCVSLATNTLQFKSTCTFSHLVDAFIQSNLLMKKYLDCHAVFKKKTWMPTLVLNLFDSKVQHCPQQYWKLVLINCIYSVYSWPLRADWILYVKRWDLKLLKHSWKQSSPCYVWRLFRYDSALLLKFCLFQPNKLLLVCKCLSPAHSIALLIVPIYRWTIGFPHCDQRLNWTWKK